MSIFGVILVRIFPNLDWIRRETLYLSIFSLNTGKCGPEYLRIRTLFTQCMCANVGPFFPLFPFPSQSFAPTWWNDGKVFSKVFQFKSFNSNRYKIVKNQKKKKEKKKWNKYSSNYQKNYNHPVNTQAQINYCFRKYLHFTL